MAYVVQRGDDGERSDLMTPSEVREVLGVSRWTLARLVALGRLPRIDLGPRTARYVVGDVMALKRARGRDEGPPPDGEGPS